MYGVMGKILWVDLTSGEITVETPSDDLYRDYVGGYGIGVRLLYDRMPAGVDPMGPDAILGLTTGPLTGTRAITGNRFTVVGKSPKTGTWGDANCGGNFGPALKFSGYDAIYFRGISPKPVYLYVRDGKAEIRDATPYWGNGVDVEAELIKELGDDVKVAWIGRAGENKNLTASVMNDLGRAAARSGLGAVMGSKNLKAVAVAGTQKVPVADEAGLNAYVTESMRAAKAENSPAYQLFTTFGTSGLAAASAMNGDSPVKNWAGSGEGDFPGASKVSDVALDKYRVRRTGCWHCTISCGAYVSVPDGPYATSGEYEHRPEYETLAAFGSMLLMDDTEAMLKVNELCNRAGMDTIAAGTTVAFAIECFERGIINVEDTGGLELRWGNAPAIVEVTRQMAERTGFGAILADGAKKAAERIGKDSAQYAIHVKGEEPGMHDPRYSPGMALNFHLDPTPGRHTTGGTGELEFFTGQDVLPLPAPLNVHKRDYANKGLPHRVLVNERQVANSAGICIFSAFIVPQDALVRELTFVTGEPWDIDRVQVTGERIQTLRHAFNLREGINPVRDCPVPQRCLDGTGLKSGMGKGYVVDLDAMRDSYVSVVGWDKETTVPSVESLRAVGLDDLVKDLHPQTVES